MIKIHCQEPWFSKIKFGLKKIEGRKYSAQYAALQPGEMVLFYFDNDSFLAEIVKVVTYATLEDYLTIEGVQNALPGIITLDDAVEVYLGFNSREKLQQAGGFLAIHVKAKEKI